MSNKKAMSVVCSNCGAQITVDSQQETVSCHYCGTSFSVADLLDESDAVRCEKIKAQTYKDIEMSKIQVERERMSQKIDREKIQQEEERINQFKRGKFSKFLLIFAAICMVSCFMAFSKARIMPGIISLVQTVLFVMSWLMGMQIIKEKKRGIHILVAVAALLLIIPYFRLNGVQKDSDRAVKIVWTDLELGTILPEPESNIGEVHIDSGDTLLIDIYKISEKQYNSYIAACKKHGFTIDTDKTSALYNAYNEAGYELTLLYSENRKEMTITINAPMEMSEFEWPTGDIGKLLPIPKSNIGSISQESSTGFIVYVGKTTKEDYNAYVTECIRKGFSVDYSRRDNDYHAENEEGYVLSLNYEGNHVMRVSIDAPSPKETEEPSKEPSKQEESPEASASGSALEEETGVPDLETPTENLADGGIRPEFKEALDSYEAFIDEYIAFMERYANSDNAIGMLSDYLSYMEKYVETMEKLDALDEEELSTEETLYYIEVQARIVQKLADAGQ